MSYTCVMYNVGIVYIVYGRTFYLIVTPYYTIAYYTAQYFGLAYGRHGSSEVPRNPLTRWDVSSIPANGIFLTKKQKN